MSSNDTVFERGDQGLVSMSSDPCRPVWITVLEVANEFWADPDDHDCVVIELGKGAFGPWSDTLQTFRQKPKRTYHRHELKWLPGYPLREEAA